MNVSKRKKYRILIIFLAVMLFFSIALAFKIIYYYNMNEIIGLPRMDNCVMDVESIDLDSLNASLIMNGEPDKFISNSKRLYRDALYKLRKELSNNNLDIIETCRAQIRLKPDNIKCDYWDYRKAKTPYYNGVYMAGYSWSTDTQYILDALYK